MKADTATKVGLAVSIWEIVLLFFFKKTLFAMWVLILTLQFFVYMSMWQIRYSVTISFIFYQLKKIALGEFLDDLDICGTVFGWLGIEYHQTD